MAAYLGKSPQGSSRHHISRISSANGFSVNSPLKKQGPSYDKTLRWWKSISLVSFFIFLVGLSYLTIGVGWNNSQEPELRGTKTRYRYAYLTLLCDDIMAEAAMVLVHSLKRTGTPHDVVILTMNVSNRTVDSLITLGAKIEHIIDPVKYPFSVTADRMAINKPCRYSKLLMWNMVQYKKIVYLDSDLLVLDSIDSLFDRPQLSAVPDTVPPDKFNSGLMVVEPNRATYRDMIRKVPLLVSPNVGDQGFLNSYFSGWYSKSKTHQLSYNFNPLVRLAKSPAWNHFIEPSLKVLHFSGSEKPWNMKQDQQFPSTRRFDHLWWQVYDDVFYTLGRANAAKYGNHTAKLPPQLAPHCQRDYMAYSRSRPIRNKMSIVINSFDRFNVLKYMLRRYGSFDFVHKIYVVWGNTKVAPFSPSYFNVSKPVEILYSGIDSLNDRFLPIASLETEAVLICDDDIEVNENALRVALERWSENKYRLVGFFPRAHFRDPTTHLLSYVLSPRQDYSIVLTKMWIMHGDFLRSYSCNIPQEIRDYVDFHKNCEDITMNFVVTQLSGLPPLLVEDTTKIDYGTTSGLSSRGSHDFSRSVCMNDIARMLGYMSLRNNTETVNYFDRDKKIRITKERSTAESVSSVFHPVLNPHEHRISLRFMGRVPFLDHKNMADVAYIPSEDTQEAVLCIQGGTEGSSPIARYALLKPSSIPPDAVQSPGTTFMIHSTAAAFEGRFAFLHLLSTFLEWRISHGCFAPSRVMLFNADGGLVPTLTPWHHMVMRSLLSHYAVPVLPPSRNIPECFESTVVARQRDTLNVDSCNPLLGSIRSTIHAYCNAIPRHNNLSAILDDSDANVRIAFVGDGSSWAKRAWFGYLEIEKRIFQECGDMGLSCQVTMVPRGEFCSVKVLGLSRADVVIGPWQDRAMDNIVFLPAGTAVLEVVPNKQFEAELSLAKKEALCMGLNYEQLGDILGKEALLAWVSKQLDRLGRRGRRSRTEEKYALEHCLEREVRY